MPEPEFDGSSPTGDVSSPLDGTEAGSTAGHDGASTEAAERSDGYGPVEAVAAAPAPVGLALDSPALAESERLARAALAEIAPASLVGALVGVDDEGDGVYSLRFATSQPGYADWLWTVAMNRLVDEATPNVLETELLPGPDALLAPAWVPWADRLAEYEATHAEGADADDAGAETAARAVPTRRRRRTRVRVDGTQAAVDDVSAADGPSSGHAADDDESVAERDRAGSTGDDERGRRDATTRPARGTVLRTGARRRRTVRERAATEELGDTSIPEGASGSE